MTTKPVSFTLPSKKFRRFELLEFDVLFHKDYFQIDRLNRIDPLYHHDAYDADEDYTMFRAEARFTLAGKNLSYDVPVYAYQEEDKGDWKWRVRFQPNFSGTWQVNIWVLCLQPASQNEKVSFGFKKEAKNLYNYQDVSQKKVFQSNIYYEFFYGVRPNKNDVIESGKYLAWPSLYKDDYIKYPWGKSSFVVSDTKDAKIEDNEANIMGKNNMPVGPLSAPKGSENTTYFYREQYTEENSYNGYKRKPFFLFGVGRPWSIKSSDIDEYIDREADLFRPMKYYGCNFLSQWFAPWETQLVHQAESEFWPIYQNKKQKQGFTGDFQGDYYKRLTLADWKKGYRRYDQGRAEHVDKIFSMASKYNVTLMLSVFTHQSLEDKPHHWKEKGWGKNIGVITDYSHHLKEKNKNSDDSPITPNKANGFQIFQIPSRSGEEASLCIEEFFEMSPKLFDNQTWKRILWKHFANYWRYIFGRWGAHVAMGSWILIDENEGVGESTEWWYNNAPITLPWHDATIKLIRGKLSWDGVQGWNIPYTGDYLNHPISSSDTEYQRPIGSLTDNTIQKLSTTKETKARKEWFDDRKEDFDFYSHHIYQSVPSFGYWGYQKPPKNLKERLDGKRAYFALSSEQMKLRKEKDWWPLPNGQGIEFIDTGRWLWLSFLLRVQSWTNALEHSQKKRPLLISEFGAHERKIIIAKKSTIKWIENKKFQTLPDFYGKIFPAYTHFAIWTGFTLGHAGIPIKWNDGKELGEMKYRTLATPKMKEFFRMGKEDYPINNFEHVSPLVQFISSIEEKMEKLHHSKQNSHIKEATLRTTTTSFNLKTKSFNLSFFELSSVNYDFIILWIFDISFSQVYSEKNIKSKNESFFLHLNGLQKNESYKYAWFNTWDGLYFKEKSTSKIIHPAITNDIVVKKDGTIELQFHGFPSFHGQFKKSVHAKAQGNDILLILQKE